MSGLIDPRTGRPTTPSRKITDDDLVKILQAQSIKIDMLNQQNMQLGLYIEFILEHLLQMTDDNDEPLLVMDIQEFPAFAQKRLEEIQEEMVQAQAQAQTQNAESILSSLPEGIPTEINLDE